MDLAEALIQGVLSCTFYGVMLGTGALVLRGTVAVLLRTGSAARFNMVRSHRETIQYAADNAINFVGVIMWIGYALHGFGLRSETIEFLRRATTAEFTIFGTTFHPFAVIPILIALWLTFKISKLVSFVLENDVLDDPAPSVPFMGFGASSLDFEVRAWTVEDIVRVKSELAVGVNRTLKAAGIEIPFPQRDVHIRTPEAEGS